MLGCECIEMIHLSAFTCIFVHLNAAMIYVCHNEFRNKHFRDFLGTCYGFFLHKTNFSSNYSI